MRFAPTFSKRPRVLIGLIPLLCVGVALPAAWHPKGGHPSRSVNFAEPCKVPTYRFSQATAGMKPADPATQAHIQKAYGQLPLQFEANRGQTDSQVKFVSRSNGSTLFLTSTEAVLALQRPGVHPEGRPHGKRALAARRTNDRPTAEPPPTILRMRLAGANPAPQVVGQDALAGKVNYYLDGAKDRSRGETGVPTYRRVKYQGVYPGIDMVYYGNQRQLEYDFLVQPGADPNRIRLSFTGADKLSIDAQGDLVLSTAGGQIRQQRPRIYQEVHGKPQQIAGRYALEGDHAVGFRLAAYDPAKPLRIDPVIAYSTYLGAAADGGNAIAVDAAGNAYVTGYTWSFAFPTVNAVQPTYGTNEDAFVTKFDATGTTLVYSTYLGGPGKDFGNAIAVDADGNAYVTGQASYNPDFPNIYDDHRVFVAKLDPNGALLYFVSVYGSGDDQGNGIAIDSQGYACVVGSSSGGRLQGFPIWRGFQTRYGGYGDAFVMVLTPDGQYIAYSTYIGGPGVDWGNAIALDPNGYIYVAGMTGGGLTTTPGAFQTTYGGDLGDAFVAKINPGLSGADSLVFLTYLGGSDYDEASAIAVDAAGCAYVTGSTKSSDFVSTPGAFQTAINLSNCTDIPGRFYQCDNAYVTKLSADGSSVIYSTYLGGLGQNDGNAIAVDANGSAYVTGQASPFFPTVNAFQPNYGGGGSDAFVAQLSADGSSLLFASFLGGSSYDKGHGIALDTNGSIYLVGETSSPDLPTLNAFQPALSGSNNAFVTKITMP